MSRVDMTKKVIISLNEDIYLIFVIEAIILGRKWIPPLQIKFNQLHFHLISVLVFFLVCGVLVIIQLIY